MIDLDSPIEEQSRIIFYNALGREVKTVQLENGVQQKTVDVKYFQSGIYFYQIEIANEDNNGKLMIVK